MKGFNQARFKKFSTEDEAESFIKGVDSIGEVLVRHLNFFIVLIIFCKYNILFFFYQQTVL